MARTSFDQGDDRTLLLADIALEVGTALALRTGDGRLDLAVVGFVGLNHLSLATKRRGVRVGHHLADAVRHEPSGLVGHLEHAA
jgi:hypothetical protein